MKLTDQTYIPAPPDILDGLLVEAARVRPESLKRERPLNTNCCVPGCLPLVQVAGVHPLGPRRVVSELRRGSCASGRRQRGGRPGKCRRVVQSRLGDVFSILLLYPVNEVPRLRFTDLSMVYTYRHSATVLANMAHICRQHPSPMVSSTL